ncbi:MAG: PKD domain-containing protein, partial [Alcanivoracaceae bacterium]|nr:PKD domain-containing protein [Alcanivoracaceae bacterium]
TIQGLGGCPAMAITINHNNNNAVVGALQDFSVNVSGGVSPYKYQWDVNDDQSFDGSESTISATYSQAFVGNVRVTVTDSEGCTDSGSTALVIEAPRVNLLTAGNAVQMCGNSDGFVDPGERWSVPVTMQNNGFAEAQGTYAVFSKSSANDNINIIAQDNFGNGVGLCARQFIDISASGTELTLVDADPNDDFAATDEGVASINLSQPFNLYGNAISSLYLSSNGYISTNSAESGFDFDNDCPLPALPNNTANGVTTSARLIPLHDDLITQHIYHQHFNTCPRQSELAQDLACDIFMYNDVELFATNTVEHFDFEAILYATVNQWVYQYNGTGFNPASSTIGLQSDGATDGVSFACNTPNSINTQQAVCVYHADNQSDSDNTFFHLETPVLALDDLQVSQQHNANIEFSIAEDAVCDTAFAIRMQAAVYESGFNKDGSEVFSNTLGNNGSCSVVSNCAPNSSNDIQADNGLWFNPRRSGNGNDMYFSENGLLYIQYTALADRSPIWYITGAGSMQNNQAYNELTKVSYNGPFLSSTQTVTSVGESVTTLIDASNAVQTRTINGEFSADLINAFVFSGAVNEQRTGLWFNPVEAGWGETVATQGDVEVVINYLYDNSGQPYWVLGGGANSAVEDIDMSYSSTFCPHCPVVPIQSTMVGTVRIDYDASNRTATMENMQINVNTNEHTSQWDRNNMPMSIITAPLE